MLRFVSSITSGRSAAGLASAMIVTAMVSGAAAAETAIRFSLDFGFEGPSAPFLLPFDKGYYKSEGLDVSLEPSANSLQTLKQVASGAFDMGFCDINALIKFRDANAEMPVTAVFMVYNRPPFAVVGRKSRGVSLPKDLEGKKLGAPALDETYAQWPIFVQANGIDGGKVTIENVGFPVRNPMLAAGQLDAITGFSFSLFINLKDKGVPVNDISVLLMADYGVDLYGHAIVVNPKFAAAHPEAVKGFLRAFAKGLKETVKQPASAIEAVLRRNDAAKKDVEVERLRMAIRDNIVTPEVKANGYGGIDNARFARAVEQIALTYKFKTAKPKPQDVFDASYLPPAADRKVN
ncbi:MAG: ABC transporter substrate-binding protein [Pseudolabrys sp.]